MQGLKISDKYIVFNSDNDNVIMCPSLREAKKQAAIMGECFVRDNQPTISVLIAEVVLDCDISVKYTPKFTNWEE